MTILRQLTWELSTSQVPDSRNLEFNSTQEAFCLLALVFPGSALTGSRAEALGGVNLIFDCT